MKCKPYSKITVEIRTQLKTVKITLNIFAVHWLCFEERELNFCNCYLSLLYFCSSRWFQYFFFKFKQVILNFVHIHVLIIMF